MDSQEEENLEIIEEDRYEGQTTQIWTNTRGQSQNEVNRKTLASRNSASGHIDDKLNVITETKRPVTVARDDTVKNEEAAPNFGKYQGEEDDITCGRFPHLDACGCDIPCLIALKEIKLIEVIDGIFMGPYQACFKTKELLEAGVTHILNVSTKQYTKRKYFKYLDINIYDVHSEDAKKHF